MQPLPNPDDLPTLLSRFHTWAEKQPIPTNGNGHGNGDGLDGVRELTYEEAIEQHRSRPAPQRERRTTPARPRAAAEAGEAKAEPPKAPPAIAAEISPRNTEIPLPETAAPTEEIVAAPQVELPPVEETPKKPEVRVSAPPAAKKVVKPAVALSSAKPAKTAPPPAAKPKVAIGRKHSAPAPAKAAKAATPAQPLRKKPAPGPAKKCARKEPEFRHVLAKSIRCAARKPVASKKTKTPDRSHRVSTRLSTSEERRIEKAASLAGMTVSTYLRKCALAPQQVRPVQLQTRTPAMKRSKARTAVASEPEPRSFAQSPSTSFVGGWFTLLRQRFLSSPARFAERA